MNEILTLPAEVDWNGDGAVNDGDEWIELFNSGKKAINLGGWILRDQREGQARYQMPPGTVIKPGKFLLLYRFETNVDLASSGGVLQLVNADGQVVDSVTYAALAADASYSRGDLGNWHSDWVPSPGTQNTPQGSGLQQPKEKGKKK